MHPILLQTSDFTLYSYPFFLGLAWGVGYHFFHAALSGYKKFFLLFLMLFLSAWLGGKVFFLLTYPYPDNFKTDALNFWLGGGFVFLGGLFGACLTLGLWYKKTQIPSAEQAKKLLMGLVFGHAIGRLGCYMAGCCYGYHTDLWWGILSDHLHPTQLLESLGLFLIGFFLYSKKDLSFKLSLSFYLISYGSLRFFIEFLRGDSARGLWIGFPPSQLLSLILVFIGFLLFFSHKKQALS